MVYCRNRAVRDAAEQKKTIVMVTHSTQIAQQLADGIVHMENGHAEGYQQ